MRRRSSLLVVACVLVAAGCDGAQNPAGPSPELPSARISDGRFLGGNDDFFFLPPVMPDPRGHANYDAAGFNPRLGPTVSVCQLAANPLTNPTTDCALDASNKPILVASFTSSQVAVAADQYHVNWHTDESNLFVDRFYRLQVSLGSVRIGFADIDPVTNARDLKNANTGQVIPLVDGRTLPVKFRIENGVLCENKTDCGEFKVTNTGGTFTTNTKDAAIQFQDGFLPAGVSEITLRIERITVGSDNNCHGDLGAQLWKQFEGCYEITSDPDLEPFGGIQKSAIAAQCVEVSLTDPYYPFLAPYKSRNGQLTRLRNAAQTFLDCEGFSGSTVSARSSNPLVRYASSGLRQLGSGFGRVFGVRTAEAIDLGLGEELPIGSALSRFNWAIGLEPDVSGGTPQSVGFGLPAAQPLEVHVMTRHFHAGEVDEDDGHTQDIAGVDVIFTVDEGDGYFELDEAGGPVRRKTAVSNADGRVSVPFTAASNQAGNVVVASVARLDLDEEPPPPLTFSIAGLASDLVIENLTRSIAEPNTGDPLSWSFAVRNTGAGVAVPSVARLVVSLEEEGTETVASYDVPVPKLNPGASVTVSTPVLAAPRDEGDHSVLVMANATSAVVEANDENNTASQDFTVAAVLPAAPPLLAPASGAQIPQNVQSNGCSLSPTSPRRGFGEQIFFDWSDVAGATQYRLVAQHTSAEIPIVSVVVEQSQYSFVRCNSFVVDGNLANWFWQVQTFANGVWGPFGAPRPFEFLPCRLPDGTACNTGEGPYPGPGDVTGSVTDAATGDPLPGAQVTIVGTSFSAITDCAGDYLMTNVPPGTYTMRATFSGYAPQTVTGVVLSGGGTVNFALTQTPTIDGLIDSGEWDDATSFGPFTVSLPGERSTTATILMKNTSDRVFMALVFADDLSDHAFVTAELYMDENANGFWDNEEDGFRVHQRAEGLRANTFTDMFCSGPPTACSRDDESFGGTRDGIASSTDSDTPTIIEVAKGINTPDVRDAPLASGQILRFTLLTIIRTPTTLANTLLPATGWASYTVR